MTIWISNPSKQPFEFFYRLAITNDASGPMSIPIAAGGQVEIGHGWTREQTAYVIRQIERNGGASVTSARGRLETFTGLLYDDRLPLTVEDIEGAHKSVLQHQEDRAAIQATRGALGFDRVVNQSGKTRQRVAKVTEVEVIQELPRNQRPTGDEVHFKLSVDSENGRSDVKIPV